MNVATKPIAGVSVYAKIAAVQGELAKVGIAKTRRNQQGSGYNFRGIDDVYAALSPLLASNGLVIVPRVISREVVERNSKSGGALFFVTVHAEFDFISADDGSCHTAATFGEAMDSGDKATNKAMSAAYKYLCFMTFAIPTEGDNDADAHTPEVAGGQRELGRTVSPPPPISNTQWAELESLIPAAKLTPAQFCQTMGCATVKELPAAKFEEAKERLNARLAELVKAETNEKAKAHA